jgi:ornithine carbamoyltransferase
MIDLAIDLKKAKYGGYERKHLTGKNIALIFEKTSTRTRCAFEVAAFDQGAQVSTSAQAVPRSVTRSP